MSIHFYPFKYASKIFRLFETPVNRSKLNIGYTVCALYSLKFDYDEREKENMKGEVKQLQL